MKTLLLLLTLANGFIDKDGNYYPEVDNGAIDPQTGQFYPKVKEGYIDPETGEYYPELDPRDDEPVENYEDRFDW